MYLYDFSIHERLNSIFHPRFYWDGNCSEVEDDMKELNVVGHRKLLISNKTSGVMVSIPFSLVRRKEIQLWDAV